MIGTTCVSWLSMALGSMLDVLSLARAGREMMMATTARSWMMRVERLSFPDICWRSLFDWSVWRTTAVDEMESARAAAREGHGLGKKIATTGQMRSVEAMVDAMPAAAILERAPLNAEKSRWMPMPKRRKTMARLPRDSTADGSWTMPMAPGPMREPVKRYAGMVASLSLLRMSATMAAATRTVTKVGRSADCDCSAEVEASVPRKPSVML